MSARIDLPQFQAGDPPYLESGGNWVFDENGHLVTQRIEAVPVSIVLPKGKMPADGWPLVLMPRGTTGIAAQMLQAGPYDFLFDGSFAVVVKANPVHPDREFPPGVTGITGYEMYNMGNLAALRDSVRQGVAEWAIHLRTAG